MEKKANLIAYSLFGRAPLPESYATDAATQKAAVVTEKNILVRRDALLIGKHEADAR